MSHERAFDCVVIGYNDVDFHERASAARRTASTSGAYEDLKTNSVLFEGRRIPYMELLNLAIESSQGTNPDLSLFRMPSLGVLYLTSFLRRAGLGVEYVNSVSHEPERLDDLLDQHPRAVAITSTYYVENEPIREVVERVRERSPGTLVVAGGPHVYNVCEDHDVEVQDFVLAHEIGADVYIHDSQGELTLTRLLTALRERSRPNLGAIPNLIYGFDGSAFQRSPRQIENNDLDACAVDWSLIDLSRFVPTLSLRTARSCPFSCSFCNYPTMAGDHVLMAVETVEQELRALREAGVRRLNFIDDTFNVPVPRFKRLMRMMIDNRFDFEWVSFFRCSNADDECFDLMREAGCIGAFLGIESGHPQILKNMNKKSTPDRYSNGIAKLSDRGISTWASLIVGYPGESEETVQATIDLVESARPTFYNVQLYYHDMRSPIHRRAAEFGITGSGYSWSHDSMDWRDASALVRGMFRDVKGSSPLTLYGLSLWALVYLREHGFRIEDVARFGEIARPLLVDGFDEVGTGYSDPRFQEICSLVQDRGPGRRGAGAAAWAQTTASAS